MAIDGILQNFNLGVEQRTVLYPYLREVFLAETPLITRLNRYPAEGTTYNIVTYDVRPRNYTLKTAIIAGDSVLNLVDATSLLVGDILEMTDTAISGAIERIQVTAQTTDGSNVAISRAQESSVALANTAGGTPQSKNIILIGNSRTGGEIDQAATRASRYVIPQYLQTYEFPVQVAGLAIAVQATRLPPGISDVFTLEQKTQMTNFMRDMEYTSYYGNGQLAAAGNNMRATQRGVKNLIGWFGGVGVAPVGGANVNVKTAAGASYTYLSFVNDVLQKCVDGGGAPDTVICSTDFFTGLATWGFAKQQIFTAGENRLGLPISQIDLPFGVGVVSFIPSYQLRKGTAFAITGSDWCQRYIRQEFWNQRGNRGDAREGDFIADICVECGHPGWNAWVEGITSFA